MKKTFAFLVALIVAFAMAMPAMAEPTASHAPTFKRGAPPARLDKPTMVRIRQDCAKQVPAGNKREFRLCVRKAVKETRKARGMEKTAAKLEKKAEPAANTAKPPAAATAKETPKP